MEHNIINAQISNLTKTKKQNIESNLYAAEGTEKHCITIMDC